MAEDEERPIVINVPIPRKYENFKCKNTVPTYKRTLVSRAHTLVKKPSTSSLLKYSLPGDQPLRLKLLKKDGLLLPYKGYVKSIEKERFRRFMSIPLKEKYKIVSTNLRQRLCADNLTDNVRAVTETDEEFYEVVNGRPFFHRIAMFKTLKTIYDDFLRTKLEIGYKRDFIMKINYKMKRENDTYETTLATCTEQAKNFETFISSDYQKALELLQDWETLQKKLNLQNLELQAFANKIFYIKSKLIGLDYKFRVHQKYGRFLYYLSPPRWRLQNREFARSTEIETMGFDLGNSGDDLDTFAVLFEKLKIECEGRSVNPVLYFSKPKDLMDVFVRMEKQELHHFCHVTHLRPYAKKLKNEIKFLQSAMVKDSVDLVSRIKKFENFMKFHHDRMDELKHKFYKILYGSFYKTVASPEVLKLFIHLQFSYEEFKGEKPTNADLLTLAKFIERNYFDYSQRMDNLRIDFSTIDTVDDDASKMRKALMASRELRLFDRMKQKLSRVTLKQDDKPRPPLLTYEQRQQHRAKFQFRTSSKRESTKRELTEEEKEYLLYFTQWTWDENPEKYLHSF